MNIIYHISRRVIRVSRILYIYTQYRLFVFLKLNLFLFIPSKHIIYDLDILIRMGF